MMMSICRKDAKPRAKLFFRVAKWGGPLLRRPGTELPAMTRNAGCYRVVVKNLPIYKIRSQLQQWKKARMHLVWVDGQRRMTAYISRTVIRSAPAASKRRSGTDLAASSNDKPSDSVKVQARLTVNATVTTVTGARASVPVTQSRPTGAPTVSSAGATAPSASVTSQTTVQYTARPLGFKADATDYFTNFVSRQGHQDIIGGAFS